LFYCENKNLAVAAAASICMRNSRPSRRDNHLHAASAIAIPIFARLRSRLMMWTASPQRHHSAKAWPHERHKEGDRPGNSLSGSASIWPRIIFKCML
jgi:hypothetical protein